jgi:hypothetical protein
MMQLTRTFSVQPHSIEVIGTHQSGDTDFDGNGPRVTINTSIIRRGPKLFIQCHAKWQETKPDNTTFVGDSGQIEFFNVGQRFPRWHIASVNGNETFDFTDADPTVDEVLSGYGTHMIIPPGAAIVGRYEVQGDSDGGAFGGDDHPFTTVLFKPVEVKIHHTKKD